MKRFLVATMLVMGMVGVAPMPAQAERGGRADDRGSGGLSVPGEALAALESLALACAPPPTGVDPAVVDQRLADAIAGLASSLDGIPPGDTRAFAAVVSAKAMLLGPEVARRLRAGRLPSEGPVVAAFDTLAEETVRWIERETHAGAAGPDNPCFTEYGLCLSYCARQPDVWMRMLCVADCDLDFAMCVAPVIERYVGIIREAAQIGLPSPGSR